MNGSYKSDISSVVISLLIVNIFIRTTTVYLLALNAFDISKKSITAWCEDCNLVFDDRWTANSHKENERHTIRVSEFWITGKR
jgi:hypothetical protein